MNENPAARVEKWKTEQQEPKLVNDEDIDRLLETVQHYYPDGYALVSFISRTGLRKGTLRKLDLSDVDWKRQEFCIPAKRIKVVNLSVIGAVGRRPYGQNRVARTFNTERFVATKRSGSFLKDGAPTWRSSVFLCPSSFPWFRSVPNEPTCRISACGQKSVRGGLRERFGCSGRILAAPRTQRAPPPLRLEGRGIMTRLVVCVGVLALAATPFDALAETLLLAQPALSEDRLVFVYAGDLWVTDIDGTSPRRLTTGPASEFEPKISPDGTLVAFAADYENNVDVYVIPLAGGQPRRLTWHPGDDTPLAWTPGGASIAFMSRRETDHGRSGQLFHVSIEGGLPEKRMLARVYRGAYDETARRFAYISHWAGYHGLFGGTAGWRGYRGGSTPAIRIIDIERNEAITLPGRGATNLNPFWLNDDLYFLSDRDDKVMNLFRFDEATGKASRLTHEVDWDIRSASGHGSTIVYEAGGRLKRLDLPTNDVSDIPIDIRPDLPQRRTQWKEASEMIQHVGISPTGKRVIVTARGEVFTVPTDDGSTRNVTRSGDRREYTALWSPDGEKVAWIEESLEGQRLVISPQTGIGPRRRFELGSHFYTLLDWAAGKNGAIVYQDNHLGLHAVDPATGTTTLIATGHRRAPIDVATSSDGRWLAYTRKQPNFHRDLYLYHFESGASTPVTNGDVEAATPAFAKDGSVLYFSASTNAGPIQVGLNMTSQERPYRAGLYAVVLAGDGRSPLLDGTGDENDESADVENDKAGEKERDEDEPPPETRIDLEGMSERIVALPVAEQNYRNLAVAEDGSLLYIRSAQPGAAFTPPDTEQDSDLMRFDFKEKKAVVAVEGVAGFALCGNGKHLVLRMTDGSLAAAEMGEELKPKKLDLTGVRLLVHPIREWAQIFDEAWRMEREFFYAANMHGIDWQRIYDKYQPLVAHVGRREDLNALLVEMIAELQVGHNRVGGGDVHQEPKVDTGLLGANFEPDRGRYRIARRYTGESWNPFLKAPLATPGNSAGKGEYILAVNGVELTTSDNIHQRLQGTVGKQVTLRVGPNPNDRGARDIVVEPVSSESGIRLWSWIERNRELVDAATDCRVAYVYLPNTGGAGYTFFNRMFFPQVDREALLVDERSNGGGQAANYIIEVLSRQHLSGWQDRDGEFYNTPAGAIHGPKIMLIDQDAGSGGDYLPWAFRHVGIGKLIGTRTWGGLIGIRANPQLVDGGALVVPFFRFFDPDGNWSVENEGVKPDIEVDLDPVATNEGRDTQLERAIAEILSELESFTPTVPRASPPLPTRLGE